jgi:hypothetical protein
MQRKVHLSYRHWHDHTAIMVQDKIESARFWWNCAGIALSCLTGVVVVRLERLIIPDEPKPELQ